MSDPSQSVEAEKQLSPPRCTVLHAWLDVEVAEIWQHRAEQLGMHVDRLIARALP
jgi:hypothetical protein